MLSDQQDTFPSVVGTITAADDTSSPIIVRLLGGIKLFKQGQAIAIRSGGKTELLLCHLGVNYRRRTARETLLEAIWPESDRNLAGQSLSSLVYSFNRQLSDALDGAPAIISGDGYYRLNLEAGIWLDLERFETLSSAVDDYERPRRCASIGCVPRSCALNLIPPPNQPLSISSTRSASIH
jgi:DNA-binding SARP family transcriptional activator